MSVYSNRGSVVQERVIVILVVVLEVCEELVLQVLQVQALLYLWL